jgi:aminoglycoside phosphotransferase (APT) family kinase protein
VDPRLADLPAPVRSWVERVVGGQVAATEHTVPFGEARVWALRREGEIVAWLKRHRGRDKARRERFAYETWVARVGFGTPRWLGACPDAPLWSMTERAAGVRADRASLTATERAALYRGLGRFLAALHAVPHVDDDPVSVEDALRERVASWVSKGEGVVDEDLLDGVREAFAGPLPRLPRVPCHRDLGLHNALVDVAADGSVTVTVIDFGQSRPDVWLADLVKLFQRPTEVAPADHRAFFEGYGRRLTADEARLLPRLRALHGLATWVWGAEHGDAAGVRAGRRVLGEALAAVAG